MSPIRVDTDPSIFSPLRDLQKSDEDYRKIKYCGHFSTIQNAIMINSATLIINDSASVLLAVFLFKII